VLSTGPKHCGASDAFEGRSTLKSVTENFTTGAEAELSDGLFAFKLEVPSGIAERFHRGGRRNRRTNGIQGRATTFNTGNKRLYKKSVLASEPRHHQRSWVSGNVSDDIGTEPALKRFTAPGAPVEDVVTSSAPTDDETSNDSKQRAQNIDMNSPSLQHALNHLNREQADAYRLRVLSQTSGLTGSPGEISQGDEKSAEEEDEWCIL
jgi:hypothetical protein